MARIELVEDTVDVAGIALSLLRPPDAEALLDEEAFEREEFLPYWAELWPSALALAEALPEVRGLCVLELGCGLAVPSLVAACLGADVLATDWAPDALDLLPANAERNGVAVEGLVVSWGAPAPLLARAPFDLVLASDVLYERRNAELLLELLPRLGSDVLLADPGRPALRGFLAAAAEDWEVAAAPPVYRLEHRS